METINIPRTQERYGTFSSSNIYKLLTKDRSGKGIGAPGKKYIRQVNYEIAMDRPINAEHDALPTTWGKLGELRVFEILPTAYALVNKNRLFHPEIIYWSGAPDLISEDCESDIKCPWSLEVFGNKIAALTAGIEAYKEEFPEDFWQHISNCTLLRENGIPVKYFEPILYVPYRSEIEEMKKIVNLMDGFEMRKFSRIVNMDEEELPWLKEGGKYKNLNIFRFHIPEEDCEELTETVRECGKLLDKTF
jgi:hypothetical protein